MSIPSLPFSGIQYPDDRLDITLLSQTLESQETIQHTNEERSAAIKNGSKRKTREDGVPPGTFVADTYLKRSKTLIKKAQELDDSTGAFVVTFMARPESIGEGRYRIFISDKLKSADPDLAKRIDAAMDEIKATATEIAHRSRLPVRRAKRMHVDVNAQEETITSERALDPLLTSRHKDQPLTQASGPDNSTQGSRQASAPSTDVACLPHRYLPSLAPMRVSHHTFNIGDEIQALLDRNDMDNFKRLINTSSIDNQLYALAEMKNWISPDPSPFLRRSAMVIRRLVKLLTSDTASDEVIRESILFLSQMSNNEYLRNETKSAGANHYLLTRLSRTTSQDMLELIVRTLPQWKLPNYDLPSISDKLVRPLLSLLSSGQASHWSLVIEAFRTCHDIKPQNRGQICHALCHPPSGIPNLVALDKVSSIIGHWRDRYSSPNFSDEDITQIKEHLLRPALDLIHDPSPKVRLVAIRSLRHLSSHHVIARHIDFSIVMPPLLSLVSTNDDSLFVELSSFVLSQLDHRQRIDFPEHIKVAVGRRLLGLFSHSDVQIAKAAIDNACWMTLPQGEVQEALLSKITSGRGRVSMLSPLGSEDWCLRDGILAFLWDSHIGSQIKFCQDDVPQLLRCLILESNPTAPSTRIINVIACALNSDGLADAFVKAGAIPHLLSMFSPVKFSQAKYPVRLGSDLLNCVRVLSKSSDEAMDAFLDAGVVQSISEAIRLISNLWLEVDAPSNYESFYYCGLLEETCELLQHFLCYLINKDDL